MRYTIIPKVIFLFLLGYLPLMGAGECIKEFFEHARIEQEKQPGFILSIEQVGSFVRDNQVRLAEDTSTLKITFKLWHETENYDQKLWSHLAHIFLDLSLVQDLKNPQPLCQYFMGEPANSMFMNNDWGAGVYSDMEIKGDYTDTLELTLYSFRKTTCNCNKKWHPDDLSVECACRKFKNHDGSVAFFDANRWQKIVAAFILYIIKLLDCKAGVVLSEAHVFGVFGRSFNEILLSAANDNSGIHGVCEVSMYDGSGVGLSCDICLQKNDLQDWHAKKKL